MSMKSAIRRLVPIRIRLLRYKLNDRLRYYPELFLSLGHGLECPFCGWHFRRFRPGGSPYPALSEKRVIGASYRPNATCPRCHSNDRERLLYFYLRDRTSIFSAQLKLMHLAPEPQLYRLFRSCVKLDYVTGDFDHPLAMVRMDVIRIPCPDHSFDAVICCHVLEHVQDDRQAMHELYRILKPGGWAILQVPVALALEHTYENPAATTDEERIRNFGQRDHVRLYAANDYLARLRSVGFCAEALSFANELGDMAIRQYGLLREEKIYFCKKSS